MLRPQDLKVAIVLMNRAPLKGDEARNCAEAIENFERMYVAITTPAERQPEDEDTNEDED